MPHAKATTALIAASWILIAFGAAMALALVTPLAHVMHFFTDLAFWPLDGGQAPQSEAARLLQAISGGILAGWGVTTLLITRHIYAYDPAKGRAILLPALATWFLIDGAGSIAAGAAFNVVLNGGFLALFLVPLLASQREEGQPA